MPNPQSVLAMVAARHGGNNMQCKIIFRLADGQFYLFVADRGPVSVREILIHQAVVGDSQDVPHCSQDWCPTLHSLCVCTRFGDGIEIKSKY